MEYRHYVEITFDDILHMGDDDDSIFLSNLKTKHTETTAEFVALFEDDKATTNIA